MAYYDTGSNYSRFRERYLNSALVTQISDSLIEEAFLNASSRINAVLSTLYNVPFADYPATPQLVSSLHNQMVIYYLLIERGVGFIRMSPQAVEIGYTQAMDTLKSLGAGSVVDANGNVVPFGLPGVVTTKHRTVGIISNTLQVGGAYFGFGQGGRPSREEAGSTAVLV